MSEISQTYDGRLWKWDRDGAYWYSEDGDELAPWDVFATMCTHDAHIDQLEADLKTKEGALNSCAIRLGRVKEEHEALKMELSAERKHWMSPYRGMSRTRKGPEEYQGERGTVKHLKSQNAALKRENETFRTAFNDAAKRIAMGQSKQLDFKCGHCGKDTPLRIDALLKAEESEDAQPPRTDQ